jgi:hypothetical protein
VALLLFEAYPLFYGLFLYAYADWKLLLEGKSISLFRCLRNSFYPPGAEFLAELLPPTVFCVGRAFALDEVSLSLGRY